MSRLHKGFVASAIGYLILVAAVIYFVKPSTHQESEKFIPEVTKTLLCFNMETNELRSGDTKMGCNSEEESLGLSPITHSSVRPTKLNRTLEVRFLAARAAAQKEGYILNITSGFRTQAVQEKLHAEAVNKYGSEEEASKWVLPKDISHHPWGTAIDVNYPGDKIAVKWLEENGSTYGICRVYENEWWHFEPVIAPGGTCPKMAANALSSLESSPTGAEELN